MLGYIREYRFYIALAIFLLFPVLAIDTATRSPTDHRLPDRVILAISSPLQSFLSWMMDTAAGSFQNYVFLLSTQRNNVALQEENRRLLNSIASLRETQQENLRLRRLLNFEEKTALKGTLAQVIARDVSPEYRSIRINRGEQQGVKRNMAVLTDEGIVGRVFRVTGHTADVVTILDPLSAVDAIVERSRSRGIVEGKSEELAHLKYALRTDDIQPGDVLISSGLGGVFPKGVPLGAVARVNRKPFGTSQEVDIRPAVDFGKLEEVLVVQINEASPFSGTHSQ